MNKIFVSLAVVAGAVGAFGQEAPGPAFDTASIKAAEDGARGGRGMGPGMASLPLLSNFFQTSPGALTVRAQNLRNIVAWAYRVLPVQVSGPDWMSFQRFDIQAHTPGPTDGDGVRAMLRTLLADRFHMQAHRETKEMQGYVLSPGKGGVKVQESTGEGDASVVPDQKTFTVNIAKTPMSSLVELLTQVYNAPVIDETGLKGKYDIKLNIAKYMNSGGGIETDPQALIVQILQNELGLKLEPKKTGVELVVVDKIDKTPTAN